MLLKRGSKGNLVLTMQKLLRSIGFDIYCDGEFGIRTEEIVKLFQEDALLIIDGICGNRTWNALVSASKEATKNYREKIAWVKPSDLKCTLANSSSNTLSKKYNNFVNGAYFWYKPNAGNFVIGWLFSDGKLFNYSNIKRSMGTFLVKRDGTVIARRMNDTELMEYKARDEISFVIQGFDGINTKPELDSLNPDEIGRKCLRPVLGYNSKSNKVLIAVFQGSYKEVKNILEKYECEGGLGLDAGGSTNFYLNGKAIYKTSRILNNIIYW